MTQQGLEAIERTRKNGLWENAERILIDDEQIRMFKEIIQPHEPAFANLQAMSHSIQRTYTGLYFDAKSEKTRQARIVKIIDRLNRNLKPM
ncbi:MAG: YdeI/OmpD-associated family protein [Marinilabiliales bacterium]|nr:YdeI/OmpD-associated family protein [Marinilabiliales bacterium]